jgi:membrane protease YdiL (CAAX protease family)
VHPLEGVPLIAALYHMVLFGVVLPYKIVQARHKLSTADPLPPLRRHLRTVFASLSILGLLSVMVAYLARIPLFPAQMPRLVDWAAGAAFVAIVVTCMRPLWSRSVQTRSRRVYFVMPNNLVEMCWWVAVSLVAGVSEEITWRGVQWSLLTNVLHSSFAAAALCCLSFAMAHAQQGLRSVLIIGGIAAMMHGLVYVTGSLYVAMAVHAAYDIIAGLCYSRLGRKLGYVPEPLAAFRRNLRHNH